ncbi:MAG: hypothetical protein OHK0037_33540 [Elainellaceae cyanobacterium]
MSNIPLEPPHLSPNEYQLLQQLRDRSPAQNPPMPPLTLGDRVADRVAAIIGSWRFIITQSVLLAAWVVLNIVAVIRHWDPYPFILLNLMLSFQAAYAGPIIMMSQNRQSVIDRQDAKHDYEINMKSELEIEFVHDKLNRLEHEGLKEVLTLLRDQQTRLDRLESLLQSINRHSS